MKRRFWMWMTIVCILVVGVSVTKMTRDFIISQNLSKEIEETTGAVTHIEDEVIEETIEEVMEAASIDTVERQFLKKFFLYLQKQVRKHRSTRRIMLRYRKP
ncbi:MAG: hypothetical protein IIV75_07650 [Lachnospiraceae bacterium]|nr:hypothetical protein [Lachnospiraceae bacterium]